MSSAYDIAVIGGGMVGTAAAYHCAKAGLKTLLLERKHLASGGSGGNFGLVLPTTGRFDIPYALNREKEGLRRMAGLEQELDFDIEYRPAHGYCLLCNEEEVAMFTTHCDHFTAAGFGERFITPRELKEAEPNLAVGPEIIAALQTDEAVVNPMRLVYGFWREAQRAGAELRCYSPITSFQLDGDRITQVHTQTETFTVNQVALTAGSWTRQIGLLFGANLPEYYINAEAVVTESLPRMLNGFVYWGNVLRIPAEARIASQAVVDGWENLGNQLLFSSYDFGTVQTRRGNFLFGQMTYITPEMRSQVSYPVMPGSAREALQLFPQLRKARILRSWRSPAPFTPDHLPLVGRIPPLSNVFVASGFQSAITSCHWAGEFIADLAQGHRLPAETSIFDPGRYTNSHQVQA